MSGRLIILRHKSWHVWNQDNIEKVKRDERLAAEDADKRAKKQRFVDQEVRLKQLKEKKSRKRRRSEDARAGQSGEKPISEEHTTGEDPLKHINFFEEEEREATKILGTNPEHEQEEKDRQLRELKRKNLAPWALGEGSAEKLKDSKPWYHYKRQDGASPKQMVVRNRMLTGEEAKNAWGRDERRKHNQDPMATLVQSTELSKFPHHEDTNKKTETEKRSKNHKFETKKKKKKSKKQKRKKKKQGKKAKKKTKRRRSEGSSSSSDSDSHDDQGKQKTMEMLRLKRLEREKEERSRAVGMLAERQMAGLPVPGDRERGYNSQFNPTIAKRR